MFRCDVPEVERDDLSVDFLLHPGEREHVQHALAMADDVIVNHQLTLETLEDAVQRLWNDWARMGVPAQPSGS